MWDMKQASEPELNIHYKEGSEKVQHRHKIISNESDDSENAPLLSPTRTPDKIIPSILEITFGDITSTVIYSKKQVA